MVLRPSELQGQLVTMDFKSALILAFVVVSQVLCDDGQGKRHSIYKELSDFVIASSNPLVIPKKSLPIRLGVQMGVVAIHGIDRERNLMDVTRWGSVTWQSDLTWDDADFSGLKNISIPYRYIWVPDLHLYNSVSDFQIVRDPAAVLFNSGMHVVFARTRSTIHCGDDLDHDVCSFRIASWGSNINATRINEHEDNVYDMNAILANEAVEFSRFEVLSHQYKKSTKRIATLPDHVDVMDFVFSFKDKNPPRNNGPFRAMFQWS